MEVTKNTDHIDEYLIQEMKGLSKVTSKKDFRLDKIESKEGIKPDARNPNGSFFSCDPMLIDEKKALMEALKKSGIIYDYRIKGFTEYTKGKYLQYTRLYVKRSSKAEFGVL